MYSHLSSVPEEAANIVLRTINNFAYLVPILTNVAMGRKTMHRGPFYLSYLAGMVVNIVTVLWLVFAIVFFSFPYYMPVTGRFTL